MNDTTPKPTRPPIGEWKAQCTASSCVPGHWLVLAIEYIEHIEAENAEITTQLEDVWGMLKKALFDDRELTAEEIAYGRSLKDKAHKWLRDQVAELEAAKKGHDNDNPSSL